MTRPILEIAPLLTLDGQRCGLSPCPSGRGVGHANEVQVLRLRCNKDHTKWWYATGCAPKKRQPVDSLPERCIDLLHRLNRWPETRGVLAAFGDGVLA